MAGRSMDPAAHSPTERKEDSSSISFAGSAPFQNEFGSGQTNRDSEVLIELLKVPPTRWLKLLENRFTGKLSIIKLSSTPLEPFTSNRYARDSGSLRMPSLCWICHRLLACLSKTLAKKGATFTLRASTSDCTLNHELLIAIRIFLKWKGFKPDQITVESTNLDPLRLTIGTKNPGAEETVNAQGDRSVIQSPKLSTWMWQSFVIYQEIKATRIGAPEVRIPKAASMPKSSDSSECLMLAKAWLDDCFHRHPQCRNRTSPELPRRVIDVTMGQLRLHIPEEGTKGDWVALSHCWGKTNTFKTTVNTLDAHECGIDWKELPKTFKDAVLVTRTLGVQYLWIDSLCIVQDDGGLDFHAEAAKMCDIYRNSILTIAASCSASDRAGFLQERVMDILELEKPRSLQSICFRQSINHSRMLHDDPIHTRAWTFQETILPRRLLSFGSCEASWECETLRRCECGEIEFGDEGKITSNELGRAAYRKYSRAVIEGKFHKGKQYGLPRLGAIGQIYARHVLAEAPEPQDREAYREYFEKVRQMTIHDVINTAEFASNNSQPFPFSNDYYITSGEVNSEDATACAELLENTLLNRLAIDAFYRYWRRVLVPEYTRRALSKDSDRLVALQAIATEIYSGIHDRYLAGLWKGDLINQLCWKSADGQCLPADNQSPSWSWSSIRGQVGPCLPDGLEKRFEVKRLEFKNGDIADETLTDSDLTDGHLTDEEMTEDDLEDEVLTEDDLPDEDPDRKFDNMLGLEEIWVYEVRCSLASKNPCGKILNGSITVRASSLRVQYIRDEKTWHFEIACSATRIKDSKCLDLEFHPDTPLRCGPDGSLARSAREDFLNTRHHEYAMKAVLLLVHLAENVAPCVLVCGLESAAATPNTCRRVGIGTFNEDNFKVFSSKCVIGKFVLI